MATAMDCSDFEGWLSSKLQKLNIDHEVFGSYIIGIMESEDSTEEDKTEALTDILSEISAPVEEVCQEIFQHWKETIQEKLDQQNHAKLQSKEDSDAKMASIMEKHATTQEVKKELTAEDRERKAALIAQYGHVSESDEESEEEDNSEAVSKPKADTDDLLTPNTNAANVVKQQKEQRDKNKQEYAKRRETEKVQREQQQQKSQDRKDKEKKRTQKQERRR